MDTLKADLKREIQAVAAGKMLHQGILNHYNQLRGEMIGCNGVNILAEGTDNVQEGFAQALLVETDAAQVLHNPELLEEVFGPFGLVISCADRHEMKILMEHLVGQITLTFAASEDDMWKYQDLFTIAQNKCGRLLFQGMPTGVEVKHAMQHGGPFPATTDSRFTSVGPDAIKRFLRPISFQNWPDEFLPKELQDGNPLQIERLVNQHWTKE
ncbi:hypothetical protein KUH03_04835 [Sphingobacterium sp. E70]|uniref:hypothetical protein n=1 Tax=Sphingobacterium sp. E70 TaxID=2853439 RepID=UPI00211B7DF8|nr:hypothetical protein [Sphingobacterium sp. E70]ULT26249.1 hypothetical protein KUH03_04835 [Sphingobacterium sp. E70]